MQVWQPHRLPVAMRFNPMHLQYIPVAHLQWCRESHLWVSDPRGVLKHLNHFPHGTVVTCVQSQAATMQQPFHFYM